MSSGEKPGAGEGEPEATEDVKAQASDERWALLEQISDMLERPMLFLSLAWLGVVLLDLFGYRHPVLEIANWVIWGAFVLHFALEFVIAPNKTDYLRTNWLTAVSLFLPALRLVRIARLARALRAARAARGLRLVRVVSTANRGLRTTRRILSRRGFGYVVLINIIVLLLGAGGMYAFERVPDGSSGSGSGSGSSGGLNDYGEALWWTAMTLTTLGAGYEPQTLEGRVLAYLLALFAFSVFGYITATLASVFVQQDRQKEETGVAPGTPHDAEADFGAAALVSSLREEMAALRQEVRSLHLALAAARSLETRDSASHQQQA